MKQSTSTTQPTLASISREHVQDAVSVRRQQRRVSQLLDLRLREGFSIIESGEDLGRLPLSLRPIR